eukprot:TRINITY_DN1293_c0_g1_i2.p1 TRINITY_DN1293_c0_g1~~TRINITY_DN1293_c0_g1_i2.p1  ORF type:complete len:221 (-),score=56.97 TRINITY_DN1293_c0_g1_i2:403-1065(-)
MALITTNNTSLSARDLAEPLLIDSLPYIDREYNIDGMRSQVEELIRREKEHFQPETDYLGHLPPAPQLSFSGSAFLQSEFERIARGETIPPLDVSRFELSFPEPSKIGDVNAWKAVVSNSQSQLEHQNLRLLNLELLNKYGANAWRSHISHLEAVHQANLSTVESIRKQTDDLHRKRKSEQTATAEKIKYLKYEYESLIHKNIQLRYVIDQLEAEVDTLR